MATMRVYAVPGETYALLRGPLRDWLKDRHIPAMHSRMRRGWHVRSERIPDLVAEAQVDGWGVIFSSEAAPR